MDVAKKMVNEKWKDQEKNNFDLFVISEAFTRLYKKDAFYASLDYNRFAITQIKPEFITYSEIIKQRFYGNLPDS
jgi:hypothetical protein